MEYKNEFNLDQELVIWRERLLDSNAMEEENIMELESHLLDEVEYLTDSGLTNEEAYLIAQKRLGQPDILVKEYRKIEEMPLGIWLRTVLGGAALSGAFISLIYSLSHILTALGHSYITESTGLVFLGMMTLFGLCIVFFSNLISLEKMKSFLESQLIKRTVLAISFAFLAKIIEGFTIHFVSRAIPMKLFGNVIVSARLMTLLVVVIILVGFVLAFRSRKIEVQTEYV